MYYVYNILEEIVLIFHEQFKFWSSEKTYEIILKLKSQSKVAKIKYIQIKKTYIYIYFHGKTNF